MSNSKNRNTSLTQGEEELVAVAVQKDLCLYDKNHRSNKEKNVAQNAWETVAT